ncbi:hypothetical protein [Geoglobus acetivorans]|uniref:Uncharacterized protein n=1 Tax=Geoglobus acetivorans TaxID=565033 RepID=A0A0A7GF52_GEOAI|nr:hypothetical protein GACE_0514 [Geoglobus acetivorans]
MKSDLLRYRDVALRVLIMLLIAYVAILFYKLQNPYAFPGIERRFAYTLIAVGTVVILLYFPYGKVTGRIEGGAWHRKFTRSTVSMYRHLKSLSTGQRFVMVAVILLMLAAVVLAFGNEADANRAAILSYFMLVVGVLNLLMEYVLNPDEDAPDPYSRSRMALSLVLLSVVIYFTPEISGKYPRLYLLPLVLLLLALFPGKFRSK